MTRDHSRFIPGEDIQTVSGWAFKAVDQASVRFAAKVQAQVMAEEASRADSQRQSGYENGYAEGYAKGHTQGVMEATLEGQRNLDAYVADQGSEAAQRFGSLFAAVEEQLALSQQAMAQGVLELACALAEQVVRRELAVNPNAVQPVIEEALGLLAADSRAATVRLHPLDLDVMAEGVQQAFAHLALGFVADSTLVPGGCVVESAGMVVDGTVQNRWRRALSPLGLESTWEASDAND